MRSFKEFLVESDDIIWYHGSQHPIEKLSTELLKSDGHKQSIGPGFYIAKNKEDAMAYGDHVYSVRLDQCNIQDYDQKPKLRIPQINSILSNLSKEDLYYALSDWDENEAKAKKDFTNSVMNEVSFGDQLMAFYISIFSSDPNAFAKAIKGSIGVDGVSRVLQTGSKIATLWSLEKIASLELANG